MNTPLQIIRPNWPAPLNVGAIQTTRLGGVSQGAYHSLNLGLHVGDDPIRVVKNRQLLASLLPSEPVWLNQVHGTKVVDAALASCVPDADAAFATRHNVVCVTMTADCLPLLMCDKKGHIVAAVHAGWRGLCDGVIEATVRKMQVPAQDLLVWLGPGIGPDAFEVGDEVRQQFIARDARAEQAFRPQADKWLGNIYLLAKQRLHAMGVTQIYGASINEDFCTYHDQARFFSYRRDQITGRMASMIWLAGPAG